MRAWKILLFAVMLVTSSMATKCDLDDWIPGGPLDRAKTRASDANYLVPPEFSVSYSAVDSAVYEILPGPAVIDPSQDPTPFSDNVVESEGWYHLEVKDVTPTDSETSEDEVKDVTLEFQGNDGRNYLVDKIDVIHKAEGSGHHPFLGGIGTNVVMHGDTGIGTSLVPKLLSYITLWGLTDLKDADTGEVIAENRVIHIMTSTAARDDSLKLGTSVDVDTTDHDIRETQTHVVLPPMSPTGEHSPVPGTDHGFLHILYDNVKLGGEKRDWKLAYEILPGPSAIDPTKSPTPFSNKIAPISALYHIHATDLTKEDAVDSEDFIPSFGLKVRRLDGTTLLLNNIDLIHKELGSPPHPFFGGVGFDKTIHGNSGVGTGLMPLLKAYITLWGTADVMDGDGMVIAEDRLIHVMVSTRARNDDLELYTSTDVDETDHSLDKIQAHVVLPPMTPDGEPSPVPGTGHGFLHVVLEKVSLEPRYDY